MKFLPDDFLFFFLNKYIYHLHFVVWIILLLANSIFDSGAEFPAGHRIKSEFVRHFAHSHFSFLKTNGIYDRKRFVKRKFAVVKNGVSCCRLFFFALRTASRSMSFTAAIVCMTASTTHETLFPFHIGQKLHYFFTIFTQALNKFGLEIFF